MVVAKSRRTASGVGDVGGDLRTLTRRASVEFGAVAHATGGLRRMQSLPFVPPLRRP